MSNENKKHTCGCNDHCTCGDECNCNETHKCSDDCTCGDHKCNCGDNCTCGDHCDCGDECNCSNKESEYLELAQRIKAEFDNFKRRNADVSVQSFNNGVAATVTKMLPALDAFKQAKTNIKDSETLKGIDMIEGLILNAFKELNVEKIDCVDKPFDPRYHNAVLTGNDNTKEEDIVLEEYQQGFILNNRVIRHSVVKINKLK